MLISPQELVLYGKQLVKDPLKMLHLKIVYDPPRVTILHHNRVYISNTDITVLIGRMQADVTAVLHHKRRICLQTYQKMVKL